MVLRRRQVLRRCLLLLIVLLAAFGVYRLGIVEVRFALDLTVRQPEHDLLIGSVRSNSNKPVCCTVQRINVTQSTVLSSEKEKHGANITTTTTSVLSNTSNCTCYFHRNETSDKNTTHYKMVVGILTAKRNPPTVVRMAKELLSQITEPGEYKFLAWISQSAADEKDIICQLKELGFDVYINNESYPELEPDRIRITFKDPLQRVKWRTTHALDYANLLSCTLEYNSDHLLILEDDLKPAKHVLDKIYHTVNETLCSYPDWGSLTLFGHRFRPDPITNVTPYGTSGGCAMVLRKNIAGGFVKFVRSDPYAAPVDMLLPRYIEENNLKVYERSPNLFQHISPHSTYSGKDQKKRSTERGRSISFVYDEDNKTLAAIPSRQSDGYIGCFVDHGGPDRRDLSGLFAFQYDGTKFRKPSPALCRKFCKNYLYFGLQNGGDCHCGNEFGQYGWAPESDCNMTCIQQRNTMCGGAFRNSVYRILY